MARFRYTAKSMDGKTKRGTMEALTENAMIQELKSQGLFLVEAKNLTEAKGYKKLNAKQLAGFCKELSTLLASGVSLVRALDIISDQEGIDPKEREIYQAVLLDLRKGIGLSDAMESKKCFPDLMIGMIRAGEGSGNLDQVTERLTLQYEKDYKLTQQVKSAMTYPVVLLVLCVAIVILIVTFILPQFQSLFDQMDSLPVPTEILIAISDFLVQKWYAALLIVFTVFMLIRIIMAIPAVRRQIDYRKVHMPVFGKLFKIIYTARFARTLSSLYSSGMPIATALGIAGNTIGNSYVEGCGTGAKRYPNVTGTAGGRWITEKTCQHDSCRRRERTTGCHAGFHRTVSGGRCRRSDQTHGNADGAAFNYDDGGDRRIYYDRSYAADLRILQCD